MTTIFLYYLLAKRVSLSGCLLDIYPRILCRVESTLCCVSQIPSCYDHFHYLVRRDRDLAGAMNRRDIIFYIGHTYIV